MADRDHLRKPKLLLLSFSNISSDARVLRQVRALREEYAVVTCGFGPQPLPGVRHIELQQSMSLRDARLQALAWHLKAYRAAYFVTPWVRQALAALRGVRPDIVFADDLDTVGLALRLAKPERIHLDLHEYWPGLRDNESGWTALRRPYFAWMLANWASQISSVTTINAPLAFRYEDEFGIKCKVVTNASPFADLSPGRPYGPLRLVHSGAANVNRRIETLIQGVAKARADVTLDIYLMGEGTPYHQELCDLAKSSGNRVRVLPPVPQGDLVGVLNGYDVGLPFLPPTTSNLKMTLPNKLFDYVQARLAVVTGPTTPIVEVVEEFDLGLVTGGFSADQLAATVEELTANSVWRFKQNADVAAPGLAADKQDLIWVDSVADIFARIKGGGKSMVFHVPFPLDPTAQSASGIRPRLMRKAFEEAGFDVVEVSGVHRERRAQIRGLRARIRSGWRPDFVYSESRTTPTGLGEPVTLATSLSRDLRFLRFCRRQGIPVGLFYRDIYWCFKEWRESLPVWLAALQIWRYHADLRWYQQALDTVFVPSQEMATYLPRMLRNRSVPLPPGASVVPSVSPARGLEGLYVGGIGSHYRMEPAFEAFRSVNGAKMTVCTRQAEWDIVRDEYADVINPHVRVTHESGAGLEMLYGQANVALLWVEPSEYRDFAVPMKLFEYIGHGKPVIASAGTLAAKCVEQWGAGWVVPYRVEELEFLLRRLVENPQEIAERALVAQEAARNNTWRVRAEEVAAVLRRR